MFVGVSVFCYS